MLCPCGSSQKFETCCEPYIIGKLDAPSPEILMRSRYSAFVIQDMGYIMKTTDPQAQDSFNMKANQEWAQSSEFIKLEILKSSEEGNKGIVEFKASFNDKAGNLHTHHEISKFRKQAGTWYFRDGKILAD